MTRSVRSHRAGPDRLAGLEAPEVKSQVLGGGITAAGFLPQALQANGFEVARHGRLEAPGRYRLVLPHQAQRRINRRRRERRAAGQGFVEDRPQAINIHRRGDGRGLARRLLRGHVTGRAEHVATVRQVAAGQKLGQAEVGDLGAEVGGQSTRRRKSRAVHPFGLSLPVAFRPVQQHVRRLQVAMDDPLLVGVMDGVGQRCHEPRGLAGGLGRAAQDVRQASPRHVFEHQVGLRRGPARGGHLAEFVELNQVRVPEPGDGPGFLDKALASSRLGPVGVAQELDRHVAAQRHLPGLEDHPHPPGTQDLHQLQAGNLWPVSQPARRGIALAAMEASGGARRGLGRRSEFLGVFEPSSEAVALPAGSVEREQLTGENASLGPFATVEIGRDARRRGAGPRRLPRLLEAIADRIDPRRRFEGELFVRAGPLGVHGAAILQLVFPEQANAAHLALDGARHAIQPGRDLLVGVAFDFPEGDLPQLGLVERVEQAPALVGQLGGLLGCGLAGQ